MKALAIGAKIWFKTVFLNAVFFGIVTMFSSDMEGFLGSFVLLIGGLVFTLPLLLIIVPLVDLSVRIPYSSKARMAWLAYYLMLLVVAFYIIIALVFDGAHRDPIWYQLMGTTIAALLVAVLTTRTSLNKLYHQHDEAAQLHNVLKIINT